MKNSKKLIALVLAMVMIFALTASALAATNTNSVMAFAADPATVKTGHEKGLTQFALSPAPLNVESVSPVTSSFKIKSGPSVKILYEYTYTVPAGTESVTISFTSSDSQNGFFMEAKNGTVTMKDFMSFQDKPDEPMTQKTVTLVDGKGSTDCILPYLVGDYDGSAENPTKIYNWTLNNSKIYQFHFVEASESISIPQNGDLPERVVVSKPGDSVDPLKVTVKAPDDSEIHYVWYQGATEETTTTVIEGNDSNTYTPLTENVGVTYYRVVATVTEAGKTPVTLQSRTTKFVVKNPNVTFSLQTYMTRALQPLESSNEKIYTLKQKLDGQADEYLLYVSGGLLTGTIPDGMSIQRIWSGSASDELNLTSDALTIDSDTNTFTIDVTKAQSKESACLANNIIRYRVYQHLLGRCLYLETSDNKVYTIVMDSESCNSAHKGYLPETVELIGADGSALNDFQVQVPAGEAPTGSVYQKTLTSSTPAVLRARVKNRCDLVGQQVTDTTRYNTWEQT